MKIILATKNKHKTLEIKSILKEKEHEIIPLPDNYKDVVEDGNSFYENALLKAKDAYYSFHTACLSDDSGLCVDALNGAPGIYSSRYAGEMASQKEMIDKLLQDMKDVPREKRMAYFITVAALVLSNEYALTTEGRVYGYIAETPYGKGGFGYDPVFIPDGYDKTFAEISENEKNKISHRYNAIKKMHDILQHIRQI